MLFNEYRKDDGTVATWETMSEKQWESWDLDNPPGENHKFWLLDAKIIKHAIQHWIYEDVKIIIPYNWYPVTFSCNRKYPPKRPNADQKVIRRGTMLECYDQCTKYINKFQNYPNETNIEKQIIYTPSLSKPKKLLREIDEENKELIKTMTSMQNNKAKFRKQGNIAKANSASLIFIKKRKRQQLLATIMQNALSAEKKAYQTIEAAIDYRRELENEQLDAKAQELEDELIFIKELKELENDNMESNREINSVLANNTIDSPQNVINTNQKQLGLLQNNMNENNMNENELNEVTILSQNSTLSSVGQDQSTTTREPAVAVVDVYFSKDTELRDKYNNMKIKNINWEDKTKRELTVNIDPSTMSTLNRDTKEAAKVISNLLQLTEAKRWSSICTKDIYSKEGMLMKCVKTRPTLQTIDELKHSYKCKQISTALDVIVEQYQQKAQKELNKYTELEINYHGEQRFIILEEKLRYLVRLQTTKIVTEFIEQKRMQMLVQGIANRNPITCDEVCGFAYLFLLTGRTCAALSDWADLTNEEMMNKLTSTLKYPERILEKTKDKSNSIKIGTLNVKRPNDDTWTVATSIAADLQELVAEMTLGSKTKFYNSIIEEKGLKAVRDLRYTRETIEKSARVSDILKNAKDIKNVIELDKWKKDTVKSIIGQIHKKQNALTRYSKALGVRQENITENNETKNKNNSKTQVSEAQTREHKSRKDLSESTQKTATNQNNDIKNKKQTDVINKNHKQNNKKQNQNEEDHQKDDTSANENSNTNENLTTQTNNNKEKLNKDDETTIDKDTTIQQGNYKGNNFDPDYYQQFRRSGYESYNERGRGKFIERHNGRGRFNNREHEDRSESYRANGRDEHHHTRFQRGGRGRGRGGRGGRGREHGYRPNQTQKYEGDKRKLEKETNKKHEGSPGKKSKY
jgi:hypothetical protein